ncbi:MAG: AbrB/MazE/SpoVT family DNA-binding domain-containing protein [Candidatus Heimdallarchaeota archaeon]
MATTKLDNKHRIQIEKKMRERIGLKAGDTVVLIPTGKEIRLIPVKTAESFVSSLKGFDYSANDHSATEALHQIAREKET